MRSAWSSWEGQKLKRHTLTLFRSDHISKVVGVMQQMQQQRATHPSAWYQAKRCRRLAERCRCKLYCYVAPHPSVVQFAPAGSRC